MKLLQNLSVHTIIMLYCKIEYYFVKFSEQIKYVRLKLHIRQSGIFLKGPCFMGYVKAQLEKTSLHLKKHEILNKEFADLPEKNICEKSLYKDTGYYL